MTNQKNLFERGSFAFNLRKDAEPDIVRLLESTVWGTKGTLYTHLHLKERIHKLRNPYYLNLRRNDHVLANVCFSQRMTSGPLGPVNAYYVRYFAFQSKFKSSERTEAKEPEKENFFRAFLKRFMSKQASDPDVNYNESLDAPSCYYAYIDSENQRSKDFTNSMGFVKVGKFDTLLMNRIKPKASQSLVLAQKEDYDWIHEKVSTAYQGYNLLTLDRLFEQDPYYVLRKNGKIVAGCQATTGRWKILQTSGKSKIYLNLLPKLPYVKNVFNPNNFEFLAFDSFFSDSEEHLWELFEAVMAETRIKYAFLFLDQKSEWHSVLYDNPKLGVFFKLFKTPPGLIMMRFVNFSEKQIHEFKSNPTFMNAFDTT